MKNIHLIPTPNPSRLWLTKLGNLTRCHDIKPIKEALGNNVNIYITSNEEIKEGDWYIRTDTDSLFNTLKGSNINIVKKYCKKIILTTDGDLIKDGVQAIDDEFLEWFVKNPSCEEVEVGYGWIRLTETDNEGYWVSIPNKQFEMQQEEPKQIKCYCGHTTYCDCSPLEEPKQETLEEAAEIHSKKMWGVYYDDIHPDIAITQTQGEISVCDFIEGAKWQQERMYSEEEVIEIAKQYAKRCQATIQSTQWLTEQFKKK